MVNSMKDPDPIPSDLKALISVARTRRTKLFFYGFVFAFVACTAFLAFNPSSSTSSPWFYNLFSSSSASSFKASIAPYRSQVSSLFSHFFPNSSSSPSVSNQIGGGGGSPKDAILGSASGPNGALRENQTQVGIGSEEKGADSVKNRVLGKNQTDGGVLNKNQSVSAIGSKGSGVSQEKQGKSGVEIKKSGVLEGGKNQTKSGSGLQGIGVSKKNQTSTNGAPLKGSGVSAGTQKESKANSTQNEHKGIEEGNRVANLTSSLAKSNGTAKSDTNGNGRKREKWIEDMIGCDIFRGHWVKDDSFPLYPEGSCPHIDEPFDCYLNGRPDRSYQKLRWQPDGCNIPRLNATDMLERLKGKRLVFVGDSLNRNMWESLVCVLRNSLKDKKKVFEASGRHEFRTEGSYSFLFKDYGATVEFFRSPFLVQEWEMPSGNGTKETLRLDIIERSSSKYKDAHIIIFNTGHWWTHEKTSKGKDYYQEGNRVYSELNVVEAFHKALNTWAKWVDANVNPKKTFVFFRGYSASHFSGGQWNSGGACDRETEPINNEKYLSSYPPKMSVLESVIKGMKTPVSYLNITRMTDYRKDAHPSVYRKQNLTAEERKDPLRFQDCSHWCLPGVPDSWNELLYAELIIKQYQMAQ